MLHVVDDMEHFGASKNFSAQRPESLLIHAAKRPGGRTQKTKIQPKLLPSLNRNNATGKSTKVSAMCGFNKISLTDQKMSVKMIT